MLYLLIISDFCSEKTINIQYMFLKVSTKRTILALIPVIFLTGIICFTIHAFGSDALNGASQMALLTASMVCSLTGMWFGGVKWINIEQAIVRNITNVGSSLLILLLIGSLSAVWMLSGIVPTLIYYGIQLIHPDLFLVCTCLICAAISVMTGSSWTTIATIGIALMGIGQAHGFHEGWTAGAIISGAYFGDKISPLSETTIMSSSVSGSPLFSHIRYMMYTTVPSMLITLLLFTLISFTHKAEGSSEIMSFTQALTSRFTITPWLLSVPFLTGILILRKTPSLITLSLSVIMASICLFFFQPEILQELTTSQSSLLKGLIQALYGPTSLETGNTELNSLIATRGMSGMLSTVWLILCAMCLGGTMQACHVLETITLLLHRFTQKLTGLVASTVGTGILLNLVTADQYISIILTASSFKEIYQKKNYDNCLLSRTTEDAVTVTSVLIPWNSCGMTQATILGVSTLTYLPFCFFNLLSPIMSILVAATGYKIKRLVRENNGKAETITFTQKVA